MHAKTALALVVIAVLLVTAAFATNVHSQAQTKTWIVDSHGNGDFTSIQSAINSANQGDTIYVKSGTYDEHPLINKTLTIAGENSTTTIIDGQGQDRQSTSPGLIAESSGSIVAVAADNVTISGLTVQNSRSGGSAIWIQGYNNVTVSNCVISKNGDGIRILYSSGDNIIGNVLQNNPDTSLGFDSSHDNVVVGNLIQNNNIGVGAGIPSFNNLFFNNNVTGNQNGFLLAMYNSTFYCNNIVGNNAQASFYGSYSNYWDNGTTGNYWSNYRGADVNHDGIGDTPYVIDANNKDNYPLIAPILISSMTMPTVPSISPSLPAPSASSVQTAPILNSSGVLPSANNPTPSVSSVPASNSFSPSFTPIVSPIFTPNPTLSSSVTTSASSQSKSSGPLNATIVGLLSIVLIAFALLLTTAFVLRRNKNKETTLSLDSGSEVKIPELPLVDCCDCGKQMQQNEEMVLFERGGIQEPVCKDCIIKQLERQGGVCPQCKEPLRWNGNLTEFLNELYHPKCAFELQQGKTTKEITREVIVKIRCPYCKNTYNEHLDNCPHCGAKRP